MKVRSIQHAALGVICTALVLLHGCSNSSSANVITVTVSPSTAIVIAGQVQTFTATVGGSTNLTVTNWPCTYSYTPPATSSTPNPTAKTGSCTSGGTLPGGTGTFGTWVISTTNGSNVLTYTAPTLANFPNPVPALTFTATSDADNKKTATATVGLDSGIRVSITPASATVPVGLTPAQQASFSASFLNAAPVGQQWHLVQPNTSSTTTNDQTANPLSDTCDPTCGTIDNNGNYTAPSTLPTDTKPAGSKSTSATTVYTVAWSQADPNHYAISTITLVAATTNAITFDGISPSTIAAGGISQDIYLSAKNFLNTTKIFFTPPGQTGGQPQQINSTNIFTIPISSQYCTPSASGVTPVVTCDASILTRIRLTSDQLGAAGTAQITVSNIPGTPTATPPCAVVSGGGTTNTTSIACPLNLVYASPALVAAVPDSFPQGQSTQFVVNGGYYGSTDKPIVSLLLDGTLDTVSLSGPRQFVGTPIGSQLSSPGLYEVSIQSQAPQSALPQFPLVTTNFAVQPTFLNIGTFTSVPLPTTPASGTNLAPSSFALNTPKGYAVMTEQAGNSIQLIDLTSTIPNLSGSPIQVPAGTTSALVASAPSSIAIDDQLNIPGFSGQDLGVVVSQGDSSLALFAVSRTSATYLKSIPVDLRTLLQQPNATGLATPYSVGVDPGTHLGVVAYSNTNIGFIVDVNPNLDGSDARTCFISGQTPPCVIGPVSMVTGTYPRVVMQPQAPFAYVTPGGNGSTSLVNLLQQGKKADIAPAVGSGTSGAVRTAGITKIICTQATPHGINPALGGTVIISGLTPADLNGTFQVIPGSVIDPWTFSYAQPGLADETETNTAVVHNGVQYGTPYYSFNTTRFVSAAAINPTTRTFAGADYNASTNQIQFISTEDQNLTSLTLTAGSCNGCTPTPSGAPEIGFNSVAFDPFTNVLLAYDPADQVGPTFPTNAVSLINPGGPGFNAPTSAYRIIAAIPVGQPGQGSYTPAGSTTPVVVNGPMTYDPKSKYVLVANAGSNTLSYLNLDQANAFKKVAIQRVQITSAGVANAQPDLSLPFPVPVAQCDPTNTDGTKPCMAQAVPLGQPANVRVLGQGFTSAAGAVARLDAQVSTTCPGAFCTTVVSDSEVDVTIPASMLTVAHDYALDVQVGGVVSNSTDLHAVGVLDLSATCAPTQNFPQGPEGVAIDAVKHVAFITNFACNSVTSIVIDPAGYVRPDNSVAPYGSILNTVTVGKNPVGIDIIPRLNYAVVSNNGDSPTGSASILDITDPTAMKVLSFTSGSTTSTTVPVGLSPLGVAIDKDRALALVANSGSNTVTAIDLTVLLPGAVTTKTPTPTTIAVSGAPTAIAIDPNRAIAVVTVLLNSASTTATAGLDVINLASNPPTRSTTASIGSLTASLTGIVYDQAISPALFYVTSTQQNAIYSFNPDSTVTQTIRVGINPYSLVYNYQTGAILTINSTSDTSSLIDSQTFKTRETLGISSLSQFAAAMDNVTNTVVMVDQNNNRVILLGMPK